MYFKQMIHYLNFYNIIIATNKQFKNKLITLYIFEIVT